MDMELVAFVKTVIDATGMVGVSAILLVFLLKSLPNFQKSVEANADSNTEAITKAITESGQKQTDSTKEAYGELKRALDENTKAVNSLRENRREDQQVIDEMRDLMKGTYRMVENLSRSNSPSKEAVGSD